MRTLLCENRDFDAWKEVFTITSIDGNIGNFTSYRPNLAGFADIFIDAINAQASKLGLQPLNK